MMQTNFSAPVPAAPKPLTLERLLATVDDLPALPEVAMKVSRMAEDPSASAQAIGRVISTDQALTARVLRLANSAFYGVSRRISTVQEAIVILGLRTVKSLTMAASVYPVLGREARGYALGKGELWRHSISCAIFAQTLARQMKPSGPQVGFVTPDEAFVAGLLHDIGKMVLSLHLNERFDEVRDYALSEKVSFLDAERKILGFDHAQAGAALAEKWNLPASLTDTIACHHDPMSAQPGHIGLACAAHIADAHCVMMGIGIGGDGLLSPLHPEAMRAVGITDDGQAVIEKFLNALKLAGPAFDFEKAL